MDKEWKVVPVPPTQIMCQAGQDKAKEWPTFPLRIASIFEAMIAAAPPPPSASNFEAAWAAADESKQIDQKGVARYWFDLGRTGQPPNVSDEPGILERINDLIDQMQHQPYGPSARRKDAVALVMAALKMFCPSANAFAALRGIDAAKWKPVAYRVLEKRPEGTWKERTSWREGAPAAGLEETVRRMPGFWRIEPAYAGPSLGVDTTNQKPYAYEYSEDNGDGTYSVVIDRGSLVQLGPREWGYGPPTNAHKDHVVRPLYTLPQTATSAAATAESMGQAELPPLPPNRYCLNSSPIYEGYTAEQMHEYARAAIASCKENSNG